MGEEEVFFFFYPVIPFRRYTIHDWPFVLTHLNAIVAMAIRLNMYCLLVLAYRQSRQKKKDIDTYHS